MPAAKARARRRRGASRDVNGEITAQVCKLLEAGTVPWRKPWSARGQQRNAQSGRPYRGINQLLLQMRQLERDYSSPFWTTYRAAAKAGGQVRRGERGTAVTFWKLLQRKDDEGSDGPPSRRVPFLRAYVVFNLDQVDGLEAPSEREPLDFAPIERAEQIIAAMPNPPRIVHGGDRAHYIPDFDRVTLPPRESFREVESYYAVAYHELTHSTAHPSRLGRPLAALAQNADGYSREELIAELGAAMLCGVAGISPPTVEASAAYIDHWVGQLRGDQRLVVVAAGRAQRACDYILDERFEEEIEADTATASAS
jgi:antirestriction protein ArdC